MSVFKKRRHKGAALSPVYYYEFERAGRRFSGSTEETDKTRALLVERAEIDRVETLLREQHKTGRTPMTLDRAFTLYADEVLCERSSRADAERDLHWLEDVIGADKLVHEITNGDLQAAIKARRACLKAAGRDEKGRVLYRPIAPATVNRTLETLRAALFYVRDHHAAMLAGLKFTRLGQPDARVREASAAEEADLFKFMREDFHDIMEFALLTGIRLDGCVSLTWACVSFEHRTIRYLKKRKAGQGETFGTLPMTAAVEAVLRRQLGHDRTHVWTFIARGKGGKGGTAGNFEAGRRYPITYWNLQIRFARAKKKAGVTNFRFHDWRHTAASRTLRRTGNLAAVQRMLGHAKVTTTMKYAHVTDGDLLATMERAQVAPTVTTEAQEHNRAAENPGSNRPESHTESHTELKLKIVE